MNEVVIAVIVMCAFGFGVLGTYFFVKKDIEIKELQKNLKIRMALAEAMQKNKKLEAEYVDLSSKIKALNDTSDVNEFNKLHHKIRELMSSDEPSKT